MTPGAETLTARWSVTSTKELRGFRVRWRHVQAGASAGPWSTPVELRRSTRELAIHGLAQQSYEVTVRATLASGAGATVSGKGTPLAPSKAVEEPVKKEVPAESEKPAAANRRRGRGIVYFAVGEGFGGLFGGGSVFDDGACV